jgi:outer membrane usher protein
MSAPSDLLLASPGRRNPAAAAAAQHPACDADGVLGSPALLALAVSAAQATGLAPASAPPEPPAPVAKTRINPTKRVLRFVVPLTDNGNYLGDVDLAVDPDDRLSVRAPRLLEMLDPILKPDIFARLTAAVGNNAEITEAELAAEQITLSYDSANLALAIGIPVASRRRSPLSLGGSSIGPKTATLQPADFSAFVNFRTAIDYVERGSNRGFVAPVSSIDWAARALGVVAEGEGYLSFRKDDPLFRRVGTRLVYDDLKDVIRFTAGDIQVTGRTFQSASTAAGISATRLYSVLEPWQQYRSSGSQSFTILAPSTVETIVNGRSVEQRMLQPGSYTLSDFPLAEGSNDVKLRIQDETGKESTVEFNLYSNLALLEKGRTEFSFFAGVYSDPTLRDIHYSRRWSTIGFVRKGLTEQLTAGANMQADADAQQVGTEVLLGNVAGLIGVELAGSRRTDGGEGFAALASYEKVFDSGGERQQSIHALVEYRSPLFAVPGALVPREPTEFRASFGYAVRLGLDRFIAFDGQYSHDRVQHDHFYSLRASGGINLGDSLAAIGELRWDHGTSHDDFVARVGLRKRIGSRSSAQVDVDTDGTVHGIYQTVGGQGVGSWAGSVDVNRTTDGTTLNANGSLITNRAELALTQLATYDQDGKRVSDVRTSLRAGTSISFADGHFAIGRPIQQAFVLATPHLSLRGHEVRIDPQAKSEDARSGTLGGAVEGSLTAYSPRLLIYDVPDAPSGYDIGAGNVQIVPPYKAGYHLEVGSDYHLLVIGRLLDRDGQPISLLAGQATDLRAPKRPAVTMFTSRGGRFGAQGLRPGRWRIEMPTEGGPTIYEVDIKDDPSGTVRVGDLRPLSQGDKK